MALVVSRLQLAAAVVALGTSSASAQGLPFEIEAFDEQDPSFFYRPAEGHTLVELDSALSLMTRIRRSRAFGEVAPSILPLVTIGEVSRGRPERHEGFIEVNYIERYEAAALQLVLERIDLGEVRLTLTSLETGQTQPFSGAQLLEAGQTALFFGTQVLELQVIVPEGAEAPPLNSIIDQVVVYTSLEPQRRNEDERGDENEQTGGPGDHDEEARCGNDNRNFSSHVAVGRLLPAGCTAFLLEGGVAATAGHCLRNELELQNLMFNLPRINPRTRVAPPPAIEDTYRLIPESVICNDCTPPYVEHGSDWGVFRLARNTNTGQSAAQAQGATLAIPPDLSVQAGRLVIGGTVLGDVTVVGYGFDLEPEGASYSQQMAHGALGTVTSSNANHARLSHSVDTESGSSGSPMLLPDANGAAATQVIGIHTGGTCRRDGETGNAGTSFTLAPLRDAVATVRASR